jgi:hypothetical protein
MKLNRVLKFYSMVIHMFLMLSIFLIGEVCATTYYVSPNGNDRNNGSANAPFKTIQKAANIVNPGDTVIVKDGIYTDTVSPSNYIVYLNRGGTSDNWITFKSQNKWGAKLDGQNNTTGYCWLFYNNANYVRIEDFEVYGCQWGGFWMNATQSNLYFYRNHVHHIGRYCSGSAYGHVGAYQGVNAQYVTYDSNIIHHIGRYMCGENDCYSDYCGTADHALYLNGAYATVINNVFYDQNSGHDIDAKAEYCEGCGSHYEIVNNTFGPSLYKKSGRILLVSNNDDVLIQNNIFYTGTSPSKPVAIQLWLTSGKGKTNIRIKNNLVYIGELITSGYTEGDIALSNNIVGQDPKFVDLSNYDFSLRSDSSAIDKGLGFPGRTVDADGNPIVGMPDIGAYEYVGTQPLYIGDTTQPAAPTIIEIQ